MNVLCANDDMAGSFAMHGTPRELAALRLSSTPKLMIASGSASVAVWDF